MVDTEGLQKLLAPRRRAGCDRAPGRLRHLDRAYAHGGAATVDEDAHALLDLHHVEQNMVRGHRCDAETAGFGGRDIGRAGDDVCGGEKRGKP